MKKKRYEKPAIQVYEFKRQPMILVGSNGGAGTQDYNWNSIPEE